jgi:hypothetical protein
VCCHLLAHLLVPGELADRVQVWVGSIRDRGVLAGLTGVHGAEPVSDAARSPPFLLWKAHLSLSQDRCVVVGELACERVYSMWVSGVAIGSQHSLLCIRVLSEAVNDLFVNAAQGTGSDFRAG